MGELKLQQDLYNVSVDALHLEAQRAAKNHLRAEAYLLEVLEVVEDRKLYEDCELTSLYQYCTKLLGLSESISCALIAVIRKSKEVPELKQSVLSGRVSLSKARKICSVVTPKDFKQWIELAASETSRVIEKCVAQANPKECVVESAKYKSVDRIALKIGVGEEFMSLLAIAKDLLSQSTSKAVTSEEALLTALKELVERRDPLKKAERAQRRAERAKARMDRSDSQAEKEFLLKSLPFPGTVKKEADETAAPEDEGAAGKVVRVASGRTQFSREYIHSALKHAVTLRDQRRCTYVYRDGTRCEYTRWLDVHHILPVAMGGANELSNLKTLCSAHHRMQHRR